MQNNLYRGGNGRFMAEKRRNLVGSLGLGGVIGAANSLFGGGGGMLAVPLLERSGLRGKQAHATAILVILPVSFVSFILYALQGAFWGAVAVPTAIGVSAGGWIGAKLLSDLPKRRVQFLFAILQLFAGLWMIFV